MVKFPVYMCMRLEMANDEFRKGRMSKNVLSLNHRWYVKYPFLYKPSKSYTEETIISNNLPNGQGFII